MRERAPTLTPDPVEAYRPRSTCWRARSPSRVAGLLSVQPKSDPTNSHRNKQSGCTRTQQLLALKTVNPIAGPPRKLTGRSQVARQVLRAEHNEANDEHNRALGEAQAEHGQ